MLFCNTIVLQLNKKQKEEVEKEIVDFILLLTKQLSLSLRDITTILCTYRLLNDTFLSKYQNFLSHKIYIFLLVIKYKSPSSFAKLTSEISISNVSEFSRSILGATSSLLSSFFMAINDKKVLGECSFSIKNEGGAVLAPSGKISGVRETGYTIDKRLVVFQLQKENGKQYTEEKWFSATDSIDGVLFFEDLRKWEQIKDLTLAQYYHQQLEMFDFVLPADEAKAER